MSAYITKWCPIHGDWDCDIDSPNDPCEYCKEEGRLCKHDKLASECKICQEIESLQQQLCETRQQLVNEKEKKRELLELLGGALPCVVRVKSTDSNLYQSIVEALPPEHDEEQP